MNPITEFVIDRNIWLRGEGSDESFLLRDEDKKRCCVGIYLGACGVPDDKIINIFTATDAKRNGVDVPEWLIKEYKKSLGKHFISSREAGELYIANDEDEVRFKEEKREQQVSEIFARNGVKVTFIN